MFVLLISENGKQHQIPTSFGKGVALTHVHYRNRVFKYIRTTAQDFVFEGMTGDNILYHSDED
jgi:hypothetical protein